MHNIPWTPKGHSWKMSKRKQFFSPDGFPNIERSRPRKHHFLKLNLPNHTNNNTANKERQGKFMVKKGTARDKTGAGAYFNKRQMLILIAKMKPLV